MDEFLPSLEAKSGTHSARIVVPRIALRSIRATSISRSGRNHQIDRLGAFALLVRFDLEGDALSLHQVFQSRPLHRGDVDEHIAAAVVGLDETVAALSVEELDCPRHGHRENSCPRIAPPLRAPRVSA